MYHANVRKVLFGGAISAWMDGYFFASAQVKGNCETTSESKKKDSTLISNNIDFSRVRIVIGKTIINDSYRINAVIAFHLTDQYFVCICSVVYLFKSNQKQH